MILRKRLCLALLLGLSGCYSTETWQGPYSCSKEKPGCPEGYQCNGKTCVPAGTKLDTGAPDRAGPDAPGNDLSLDRFSAGDQKLEASSDTLKPDVLKPDGLKPDTLKPDTLKPDTLKPDTTAVICGDNKKNGTEVCDGTDLDGKNCQTIGGGYTGGTLKCSSCNWDVTSCVKKYSLHFDGTNDAGNPPAPVTKTLPTQITFELWVKLSAADHAGAIYYNGNGGEFALRCNDTTDMVSLHLALVSTGAVVSDSSTSCASLAGAWHHIAATWDKATGKVRFLIDGVADAKVSTVPIEDLGSPPAPPWGPVLGSTWASTPEMLIDEVRIWTVIRSDQNIAYYRDKPLSPQAGLAAYWRCDEGTGLTVADSSGNGNTVTLVNGPTWSTDVPF